MQELAFHTPPVVRCFRQLCCQHLLPDLEDDVSHLRAQCWREINPNPASWSAIPHMAVRYLDIGVPPVSWTPNPLGEWRTRCQEQDELIHPSFASR